MAIQTYNGLTLEQKTFFERALLKRLLPSWYFAKYGEKKNIPRNEGGTIDFRRFESLTAVTTANLTGANEGTVPSDTSLTVNHVTASIAGYGAFVKLSDYLLEAGIDKVGTETMDVLSEQASNSIDLILQAVVEAGTTIYYVGGHTARNQITTSDVVTGLDVRKARRTLKAANALPYDGRNYIAFVHPDVAYDLMSDSAWTNANQYAGSEQIFEGELGKLYGIRFLETTNALYVAGGGSGGCDVYGTIVFGKGFYAVPDIAGSSKPEMIYHPIGSAGSSDPLNQIATFGWKSYLACARLNESNAVRIESCVSS